MLAIERLSTIKQILIQQESITVADLSLQLNVTSETVRRDLDRLSKEDDRIVRVHGGAFYRSTLKETPYVYRQNALLEEKRQIAKSAMQCIRDGDSMMMDNSTTTLCLAKQIKVSGLKLSVITNSLDIINELCDCENIKLTCIGGGYHADSRSFSGIVAIKELANFHTDSAFISCSGINQEFGLSDVNEKMSQIRSMMLNNASCRYLLIDHTKFGRCKTNKIAPLSILDSVFTDIRPEDSWLKVFEENNVRCCFGDDPDKKEETMEQTK